MTEIDYRPEHCEYCGADTWCELRANNKRQCRACKVERYFEYFLYPPVGVHLMDWSRKILRDLYGTLDMETGLRQYRTAFLELPKQNGKSFLSGGLPLYHLDVEIVPGNDPEVYGAAGSREQAGLVFKATSRMIQANRALRAKFKINASVKRIVRRDGALDFYQVLSADGEFADGIRPSLSIRDEIHRWKTERAETLRDVMTIGQISRAEPLDIQATTAGSEKESPMWWKEYQKAKKILADPSIDPTYYVAIYEADALRVREEPGYWQSREARVAANPSHEDRGGHLRDASLVVELNKAIASPADKPKYLRYNLNVPIQTSENPVIDMHVWRQCGGGVDLSQQLKFDIDAIVDQWGLRNRPCYPGVDASWTTDFTAVVCTFPPFAGCDAWTLLPFFWLPKERVAELGRVCQRPFSAWIDQGFITATEGNAIDLRSVLDRIRWAKSVFNVREVPYDRQNFRTEAMNLNDSGITMSEVTQDYLHLSYATKFLLQSYPDKKIRHGNHPVMNWMASCLQLKYDDKDNCLPAKPFRMKSANRIDGIQAAVTALSRALVASGPSVYSSRGLRVL